MRQLIQQNASLLPALLQEIGRENPELLQVKQRTGLLIVPLLRNKRAWTQEPYNLFFFSFQIWKSILGNRGWKWLFPLQEISRHQEQFIQMLNEPNPEPVPGGGGSAVATAAGIPGTASGENPMRYIHVTAQEKESIERVRSTKQLSPRPRSSNLNFPKVWSFQGGKHETQIGIYISNVFFAWNSSLIAAKRTGLSRGTRYTSLLRLWEEREHGRQLPFTTELWWWVKVGSFCFFCLFVLFLPPLFDCRNSQNMLMFALPNSKKIRNTDSFHISISQWHWMLISNYCL